MSYNEQLDEINAKYYYSDSPAELWEYSEKLYNLIATDVLTQEDKERAESLYLRLIVKLRFLEYLKGFKGAVFDELIRYIDEESVEAGKKGYKKSLDIMTAAKKLLTGVNGKISQVNEIKAALSEGGEEVAISAMPSLERIENTVSNISYISPFGEDVEFPDIGGRMLEYIAEVKKRADGILVSEYDRLAKENFKELAASYSLSEYFPAPEYDEGGKSNAIVLSTPFLDEALLYCAHDRRETAKLYLLDGEKLNVLDDGAIKKLVEIAVKLNYDFCVTNINLLGVEKRDVLYSAVMSAGKSGVRAYIHDGAGDDGVYQACLKLAADGGFKSSDISRTYISMPAFNDVFKEFESKKMMTAADMDKLREMPFMGFTGLNKVVAAFISGADWLKIGKKTSSYNEAAAYDYLKKLGASYLFIDSGWGNFSDNNKKVIETDGGFDYDGIKEIDRENVRRIIESNSTVFAKCGMIARYCTLGGGDISDWMKIEREEMEERVVLATKLVFRIMKLDIVPEVEILDKIENGTAGGLCYDGGKRIVYKYSCCMNWNWMVDAIVHESFHALQGKLTGGGWSEWYFTNFGITRGRVERWSISRKIYDGNTNSKVYKVHIYENDAYAFELDCDNGRNYYWNTIDLQ